VLIVYVNGDSARTLGILLSHLGHEVTLAHGGEAGLEAARASPPDLALVDIRMPGLDGLELARRLRREPGFERVRLVALTGFGQEEDRRRTREAGFDDHLIKPVDLPALQKQLGVT
jgi:two-component system CheB/CheR fusion protein